MTINSTKTDPVTPAQHPSIARLGAATERFLALARTWTTWDGRPVRSGDRLYTPHKAVRRQADHLIDHLAQVEALLAGEIPLENHWHESSTTTPADLAAFTQDDLDEATERILRLTFVLTVRLRSLDADAWALTDSEWSIENIVDHVADPWYAEQIGDLSDR